MTVESTAFWATSLMSSWEAYVYGQLSVANNYNSLYGGYGYGPYGYSLGATECILGGWEEESCRVATEWEYLAPTF